MEEENSLLFYDYGSYWHGCPHSALTKSVSIPTSQTTLISFGLRFSGNEKKHPERKLVLDAYDNPITVLGSDGSDVANGLNKTFSSLLTVGSSIFTADVENTIIEMGTGRDGLTSQYNH